MNFRNSASSSPREVSLGTCAAFGAVVIRLHFEGTPEGSLRSTEISTPFRCMGQVSEFHGGGETVFGSFPCHLCRWLAELTSSTAEQTTRDEREPVIASLMGAVRPLIIHGVSSIVCRTTPVRLNGYSNATNAAVLSLSIGV